MRETESSRNLYEIAEPQYGFFTTKQAKDAGYDESKHAYHVRVGNWIREYRGIYRLRNFPSPERPDLMLWFLWSRDRNDVPQGVYQPPDRPRPLRSVGHQSGQAAHDASQTFPAKLGDSQSSRPPQSGSGASRFGRYLRGASHYAPADSLGSDCRGEDGSDDPETSYHRSPGAWSGYPPTNRTCQPRA